MNAQLSTKGYKMRTAWWGPGSGNKKYNKGKIKAKWIVLHHTGTLSDCSNYLAHPGDGRSVSIHFHINRAGDVTHFTNLIQFGERAVFPAYHAGVSFYRGVRSFNYCSIGIELDGDGKTPFTKEQYEKLTMLVKDLLKTFDISKSNIVLHREIAPMRKTDPKPFNKAAFIARL